VPKNFSVVLALIGVQDPRRIPVLVGVGQLRSNRERTVAGAREPAELMLDALQLAAVDAGSARLLTEADSIDAVNTVSWSYEDLPGLLAARLGASVRHQYYSPVGGQWPARLLDTAAARVWPAAKRGSRSSSAVRRRPRPVYWPRPVSTRSPTAGGAPNLAGPLGSTRRCWAARRRRRPVAVSHPGLPVVREPAAL